MYLHSFYLTLVFLITEFLQKGKPVQNYTIDKTLMILYFDLFTVIAGYMEV